MKNPQTIVATSLYLASKVNHDDRTQRQVTNATGVLEITIRHLAKNVVAELSLVF